MACDFIVPYGYSSDRLCCGLSNCPCLGLYRVTSAAVLQSAAHVNWSRLWFIGSVLSYDTAIINLLLELFCLVLFYWTVVSTASVPKTLSDG